MPYTDIQLQLRELKFNLPNGDSFCILYEGYSGKLAFFIGGPTADGGFREMGIEITPEQSKELSEFLTSVGE